MHRFHPLFILQKEKLYKEHLREERDKSMDENNAADCKI